MEILQAVQILRAIDDQQEEANIVELTSAMARDEIDNLWWNNENLSSSFLKEGDSHWPWTKIAYSYNQHLLYSCVAIRSQDNYFEGAMGYQFNASSKIEVGKGCVYVGWLATAPRNRSWLVQQPIYRGIGSTLLYWAVVESYQAGFGGRITLSSLQIQNTIEFYNRKGLIHRAIA